MRKKQSWKKLLCGLLAGVLAAGMLAGCGGDKNAAEGENFAVADGGGAGAKGRFLESDLKLPEGVDSIYAARLLSDGGIGAFGSMGQLLHSTDMGETWEMKETGAMEQFYLEAVGLSPDGGAAIFGYKEGEGGESVYGMRLITGEGEYRDISLKLPEPKNADMGINGVRRAAFDDEGALWAVDFNGDMLKIDLETGESTSGCDYSGGYIEYFGFAGEKLLFVTKEGIHVYSTKDGTELGGDALLDDVVKNSVSEAEWTDGVPVTFSKGMEEGSIVYADHSGVYYHADGGSVGEQLINGELISLGDTSYTLYSVSMLDEEHFLAHVMGAGKSKLLLYSYDKNIPAVPEKEMTVYALRDSVLLHQTISLYQKSHPDVYVKLEIGVTGEDGVSQDDAITALNTKILADDAPDILILDGLPADSYVEKGILADISWLVKELEETDGVFTNITDAYAKDGAVYELPVRFYLTTVQGKGADVFGASLSAFADAAEKLKAENPDKKILSANTASDLLGILFDGDSAGWRKSDGSLDKGRIENYLTQAKRLYDIDAYTEEDVRKHTYDSNGGLESTAGSKGINLLTKKNMMGLGILTSLSDYGTVLPVNKMENVSFGVLNSQQEKSFMPYLLAGMSSGSDVTEEAQDFLRILFGKECAGGSESGFPVNKAGWEVLCAQGIEVYGPDSKGGFVITGENDEMVTVEQDCLTREEVDKFTGILEGLEAPAMTDAVIRELVVAQGTAYLKGEQSLADTVSAIEKKLELYLAE